MKIYWKNIIWNYTIRYWLLVKYYYNKDYDSMWSSFFYLHKKFITQKQYDEFEKKYWDEFTNCCEDYEVKE